MDEPATQPPAPSLRDLLEARPVSLFLDFDGTLVEIADEPGAITIAPGLSERLAGLSERLGGRLALVSGRAIENLEEHCGPLTIACAGSHGAAVRSAAGDNLRSAEALPEVVLREARDWARQRGVDTEVKPHGIALHSRGCPEFEEDCALYLADLAYRHGLMVKRGKKVAELVRPGADKSSAVRRFMELAPFAGAMPVFVGDDVTDEDGFAACQALGGYGIAVGERPSAAARFRLSDPAAVRQWAGL